MLDGMRVVEVAYYYPAPYCCKILADLGAEVIKIEPPQGDPMRYRKEIFANFNYNKKIVKMDLKKEEDLKRFYDLVRESDVVVEGFRVGVAKKLKIDYQTLRAINPSIIYCSITGFGQKNAAKPVHDINVLSLAGVCSITGLKFGKPEDPNVQLSDFASSVFAAISILAAYVHKLRTGEGRYIDVSMFNSALAAIPLHVASFGNGKGVIKDFISNPGYRIYKAKDGYVSIGILDEPKFWSEFCRALGLDYGDLSFDERIRRDEEISEKIANRLRELRVEEIEELLGDIPCGVVKNLEEVLENSEIIEEVSFEGDRYKVMKFPVRFV